MHLIDGCVVCVCARATPHAHTLRSVVWSLSSSSSTSTSFVWKAYGSNKPHIVIFSILSTLFTWFRSPGIVCSMQRANINSQSSSRFRAANIQYVCEHSVLGTNKSSMQSKRMNDTDDVVWRANCVWIENGDTLFSRIHISESATTLFFSCWIAFFLVCRRLIYRYIMNQWFVVAHLRADCGLIKQFMMINRAMFSFNNNYRSFVFDTR